MSVVADAGIAFQPSARHDGGSAFGKIIINAGDDLIVAGIFAFFTAFDQVETMGIADAWNCITEAVGSSRGNFGRTVFGFGFVAIFRQIQLGRQGEIQAAFLIAARQAVYLMVFQGIGTFGFITRRAADQEQLKSITAHIGVFRVFKGIVPGKTAIFVIQTGIIHIRPRLADNSRNELDAAAKTGNSGES